MGTQRVQEGCQDNTDTSNAAVQGPPCQSGAFFVWHVAAFLIAQDLEMMAQLPESHVCLCGVQTYSCCNAQRHKPQTNAGSMHHKSSERHIQEATACVNDLAAWHCAGPGFILAFGHFAMQLIDPEHAMLMTIHTQTLCMDGHGRIQGPQRIDLKCICGRGSTIANEEAAGQNPALSHMFLQSHQGHSDNACPDLVIGR